MTRFLTIATAAAVLSMSSIAFAGPTGPHGGRAASHPRVDRPEKAKGPSAVRGSADASRYEWKYQVRRHGFQKGSGSHLHWVRVRAD